MGANPLPIAAMPLTIATFNVENLYARFDFAGKVTRERRVVGTYSIEDAREYDIVRKSFEAAASDDVRQLTALAIAETEADVVCLQEVDSPQALDLFYENYLRPVLRQRFGAATRGLDREQRERVAPAWFYDFRTVVPGNDTRGIALGVLSRFPVSAISNAGLGYDFIREEEPDWPALEAMIATRSGLLFRRDCLEIEVETGGAPLTLFNCHFKSMQPIAKGGDGRLDTALLRRAEARGVRKLIERRFGPKGAREANWAICGDLNDFVAIEGAPAPGGALGPLFEDGFCVDPMTRLPPDERWTHYFASDDIYVQLDYLLLSPRLARANAAALPRVVRRGQPFRVPRLESLPRYPRTGWARPKASDHCPVAITLDVPG